MGKATVTARTESAEIERKTSLPHGIVEGGRYRMPTRKDPYGLESGFVVERDYRDGGARIRREPDGKVKDVPRHDMREMANRHQQAAKAHRRDEPESFAGDTYIYYRTIGYIAYHSVFYADGPADRIAAFVEKCAEATGLTIPDPHSKRLRPLSESTTCRWGVESWIRFIKPPEDLGLAMDFGPEIDIRETSPTRAEVSCNDLFLGLLAKGFRLEGGHKIEQIREGITDPKMREAFDEGMEWSKIAREEVYGMNFAA